MNEALKVADAAPGRFTAEMQVELDRLSTLVTEWFDFSRPVDDAARQIDEGVNALWNVDQPQVKHVRHVTIPALNSLDASASDAVIYTPDEAGEGVILFVHGGGWAFGSLKTHERFMRLLCSKARKTVIGTHYRLAPEHPYPAGLNDVLSALRAIEASREEFGLPEGPLVIAGDSAGANLALSALIHEIDAGRPLPCGALLFYGVFGADFDTPSYRTYADGYVLTKEIMRHHWNNYLLDETARSAPTASPLMAMDDQLRALPPLFLLAAELDPLASDTFNLQQRLSKLGRNDEVYVEHGVIHGFLQMTAVLEAARRATEAAAHAANRFMTDGKSH